MAAFNSALPPIPENIAFLTGPPVGIMLNWCLLGILIVQICDYPFLLPQIDKTYCRSDVYRLHFHNDKTWLKSFVYILFFLEIIQTSLTTADAFHWFAYGFGNMNILGTAYISPVDAPIMNSFMAYMVQLFYGWRLWILSQSRTLVAVILIIGGAQAISGLVTGILTLIDNRVSAKEVPSLTIWLAGSVIVDVIIAASMTYYLLKTRNNTRLARRTDDIVLRIVRLTIETNSLSAGVAIITLATYIAFPSDTLSFCPSYVLGKVYTNSVMVGLNNRIYQSWRGAESAPRRNLHDWSDSGNASTNPKVNSHGIMYFEENMVNTDIHLGNLGGSTAVSNGTTTTDH
ncbi:hypothetical protein BDZ94DRAFT_1311672 [Collybia nuda]|uniref:DUF6534 domain-containing protein n=1 Tax=Collybia nuda TaxID=64659 RepID=A0A9P6CFJ6_9AGAR|nr:hypothetical protein BDZ94DRAFT_1311672 [Collybia nuda]